MRKSDKTAWQTCVGANVEIGFNDEDEFISGINVFADKPCRVCKKLIYPKQRCHLQTSFRQDLLPSELVKLNKIVTCSRCSANIKKRKVPSQSY
ncbi:hypothetical protein EVAR_71782_1 [Eumeta japonica]|uniref:Uncharacterized protein n=1 Tax=Eumeta variegata TaxID=151549 RepID=A0A4C1TJP3_EUMVA|nr:hypothetical protein EVAR_71782_1 [Eumeta japonica]